MKKPLQAISSFFKKIWRFIDKKIVLPITKLIFSITEKFGLSGKKMEYWLSKSNTLLFISLFLAIVIFIVIDRKIINFSESSAEIIKSQPIDVIYNEEAYIVEGLPETVDITLVGSKTDLYIAKQVSSYDVKIDLTGLKPGTHKVNIKYNQVSDSIEYKVFPSVATVVIYDKVSESRKLNYDILNESALDDKLIVENLKLDVDEVIIKGSADKLSEVATVKALVDINNLETQEVGSSTIKDVILKSYNNNGDIVDVEIVPNKINAVATLTSPSKELPIKVIPKGDLAFGKAISSINLSQNIVTAYGDQSVLNNMEYLPIEIDVTDLNDNKQYKIEVPKPAGIRSLSINNVNIDVNLGNSVDKTIDNIKLEYINLAEGYSAYAVSDSDLEVSVVVKGVSEVVDTITSSDIKAYLDLSQYTEGEHEVPVIIEGNDTKLTYISKVKKVNIKIKK